MSKKAAEPVAPPAPPPQSGPSHTAQFELKITCLREARRPQSASPDGIASPPTPIPEFYLTYSPDWVTEQKSSVFTGEDIEVNEKYNVTITDGVVKTIAKKPFTVCIWSEPPPPSADPVAAALAASGKPGAKPAAPAPAKGGKPAEKQYECIGRLHLDTTDLLFGQRSVQISRGSLQPSSSLSIPPFRGLAGISVTLSVLNEIMSPEILALTNPMCISIMSAHNLPYGSLSYKELDRMVKPVYVAFTIFGQTELYRTSSHPHSRDIIFNHRHTVFASNPAIFAAKFKEDKLRIELHDRDPLSLLDPASDDPSASPSSDQQQQQQQQQPPKQRDSVHYGYADFVLDEMLEGQNTTDCKFKANVLPYRPTQSDFSDANALRVGPGQYVENDTTLKIRVRLNQPVSRHTTPIPAIFGAIVFVSNAAAGAEESEFPKIVEDKIRAANLSVSYPNTDEEKEAYVLNPNVVSGFDFFDGIRRVICLEGLITSPPSAAEAAGGEASSSSTPPFVQLCTELSQMCKQYNVRAIYNPSLKRVHRRYLDVYSPHFLPPKQQSDQEQQQQQQQFDLHVPHYLLIRLEASCEELMVSSNSYLRTAKKDQKRGEADVENSNNNDSNMAGGCFATLTKLTQIPDRVRMQELETLDLLPTLDALEELEKRFALHLRHLRQVREEQLEQLQYQQQQEQQNRAGRTRHEETFMTADGTMVSVPKRRSQSASGSLRWTRREQGTLYVPEEEGPAHASRAVPVDSSNIKYEDLKRRVNSASYKRRDFMNENLKTVQQLSVEQSKIKAEERSKHRYTQLPADAPVFMYSGQKLNYNEVVLEDMRRRIAKDPKNHYTYDKQHLSASFSAVTQYDSVFKEMSSSPQQLRPQFIYPQARTAEEDNHHPKRPSSARAEDLQEPWYGSVLSPPIASESIIQDDRPQFSSVPAHNGVLEPNPAFFKSVHLGGAGLAKEKADAIKKEIDEWKSKVVVEDTRQRFAYKQSEGFKATQLDRYQPLLIGGNRSSTLRHMKDDPLDQLPVSLMSMGPYHDAREKDKFQNMALSMSQSGLSKPLGKLDQETPQFDATRPFRSACFNAERDPLITLPNTKPLGRIQPLSSAESAKFAPRTAPARHLRDKNER